MTSLRLEASLKSSSKRHAAAHGHVDQQKIDLVAHRPAVIHDLAQGMGVLEALQHLLEGADQVEDARLRQGARPGS